MWVSVHSSPVSARKRARAPVTFRRPALTQSGDQKPEGLAPLAGDEFLSPDSTGEFDPGSERTLAARLTHASRTRLGATPVEWRTGE